MGLDRRKGRTGGVSELARGALYCALDLALPGDLHELQQETFARVRGRRSALDSGGLRVEVHHRVDLEFRKKEALRRGRPVAARATTSFDFEVGRLPHFLAPYVLLSDEGYPFVELNLEGPLSPRTRSVGELVSATDQATLEELERTLKLVQRAEQDRLNRSKAREERRLKGEEILRKWADRNGSELLQARLEGGFEWVTLAAEEHALHHLARLGVAEPVRVKTTTSLEAREAPYYNLRPQQEPTLQSMRRLDELRPAEDAALRFSIVLCEDAEGRRLEAIRVAVQTPLPDWLYFLTDLHPV